VRRLLHQLDVATERALGLELEEEELAAPGDHRQQVVEVVGHAARQAPDGLHLLGLAELRLEGPDGGEVPHDADDAEVLPLAALQRGRRDLDGDGPAHPARQRHGPGAAGAPLDGRQQDGRQLGGVRQDVGDVAAPGDGGHRASEEGFGGAVEGDHAAVEVQRDDPVGEGVQDVVGVALQV
jgi:hypothetical protein